MKKLLSLILTAVLVSGILTACGGKDGSAQSSGELKVITVAATAVPHAEILEAAKPIMAQKGYDLQITVFDDYVQPNNVVEEGDIDANYFQHIPYLDSFNEERGTHLVNAGGIHYEPFESMRERKVIFPMCRRALTLRFPTTPQMKPGRFFFCRTTACLS